MEVQDRPQISTSHKQEIVYKKFIFFYTKATKILLFSL